jgi:hypothetical protein
MLRLSRSVTRWLLIAFAVSIALAWPLHEAEHAGQAAVAALHDEGAPTQGHTEAGQTATCLWCLFHADPQLPPGAPPALSLHAEAAPPPVHLHGGLPSGRCPLAAPPRGPPVA